MLRRRELTGIILSTWATSQPKSLSNLRSPNLLKPRKNHQPSLLRYWLTCCCLWAVHIAEVLSSQQMRPIVFFNTTIQEGMYRVRSSFLKKQKQTTTSDMCHRWGVVRCYLYPSTALLLVYVCSCVRTERSFTCFCLVLFSHITVFEDWHVV